LDPTLEAHIVGETEDGYAFRHPLLWEVVYHRVPGPRRAVLHERVALKLEELYGDQSEEHAAELAHHFASAGRVHVDRALQYLVMAGDQAETGYAHAEAEGYYWRALELARQSGRVVTVAQTLEKLGGVLRAMRRLDEALDVLEEAAEAYQQADDLEGEGRVVALMGLVHFFRDSWEEGIALLEPVVERLEQTRPSRSLALLYTALPRVYLPIGRYAEGLAAAERAVELASQLKDERLLPDAVFVRGRALLESGRVEEAIPVLEEAIRLAEELLDLFVLAAAYSFAAQGYFARGELNRCKAYMQRWVEGVERRGGLDQMAGLWMIAEVSLLTGDWYEVPGYMERHLAATGYDHGRLGPNGLRVRGKLALYEGNWEQASARLMEYQALAERRNLAVHLLRAEALLVELDVLQEQPKQALARLEPLLDRPGWKDRPDLLVPLGWAQLEAGNLAEAGRTTHAAISASRTFQPPTSDLSVNHVALLVDALRIHGMVLGRQRSHEEAEHSFQEAVTLAQSMPYPYGEARALCEWGQVLAQEGELEQARPRLEEALAIFRRLGARPYAERTEQALDTLAPGR
jgi:tetratricopeptide (TPR) repeat protein